MNRFLLIGVCNVQHASAFGVNVLRIQIYILTYIATYTGVSDTYKDNLPLERLDYPSLTDLYR